MKSKDIVKYFKQYIDKSNKFLNKNNPEIIQVVIQEEEEITNASPKSPLNYKIVPSTKVKLIIQSFKNNKICKEDEIFEKSL